MEEINLNKPTYDTKLMDKLHVDGVKQMNRVLSNEGKADVLEVMDTQLLLDEIAYRTTVADSKLKSIHDIIATRYNGTVLSLVEKQTLLDEIKKVIEG